MTRRNSKETKQMTSDDQIEAFACELDKLCHRFVHEFEIPLASLVGVLYIKQHSMTTEAIENLLLEDAENDEADEGKEYA